jgi:hypothetical protein
MDQDVQDVLVTRLDALLGRCHLAHLDAPCFMLFVYFSFALPFLDYPLTDNLTFAIDLVVTTPPPLIGSMGIGASERTDGWD